MNSPKGGLRRPRADVSFRGVVNGLVALGGRRPYAVLSAALVLLVGCWWYASRLQVRSDIMELLPRDSPGFQAFERRLERVGGRATLLVVTESPDRAANERFIDAMSAAVLKTKAERDAYAARCETDAAARTAGPIDLSVERHQRRPRVLRVNKWLYADLADLEEADATLDAQIALRGGLVEDLLDDDTKGDAERSFGLTSSASASRRRPPRTTTFPPATSRRRTARRSRCASSPRRPAWAAGRRRALREGERASAELSPASFHPEMQVGFGGDIPNAAAEKDSLVQRRSPRRSSPRP